MGDDDYTDAEASDYYVLPNLIQWLRVIEGALTGSIVVAFTAGNILWGSTFKFDIIKD